MHPALVLQSSSYRPCSLDLSIFRPTLVRSTLVGATLIAASTLLGSCAAIDAPSTSSDSQEIIGGNSTTAYPAVANITVTTVAGPAYNCSSTLISPRVLLTAAHCLDLSEGPIDSISAYFGTRIYGQDSNFIERIDASDWIFYSPWSFAGNDLALVLLEKDSSVQPMPYNTQTLGGGAIGALTHVIGWGNTAFEVGAGRKREMSTPLTGFRNDKVLLYGTQTKNTCQGDSGGPGLITFTGGVERVTSITSYGLQGCLGESGATRVARYATWIGNWIAQKDIPQPPLLSYKSPQDGDQVRAGFQIYLEASDNSELVNVQIWINDQLEADLLGRLPPFVIAAPMVADGNIKIEARAFDNRGAMTSKIIHVTLDSKCASNDECTGVFLCSSESGQCEAPNYPLGAQCQSGPECASGQCATVDAMQLCTSSCAPDQPASCPENFVCLAAGDSGLCWPSSPDSGSSSGGCNSSGGTSGSSSAALLLLLLAVLGLRRRRLLAKG